MNAIFEKPQSHFWTGEKEGFFYLKHLTFEQENGDREELHARLAYYHLAILEQIHLKHYEVAYGLFQDLWIKRAEFITEDPLFTEELKDTFQDIISTLSDCGYRLPASGKLY